MDYFGPSISGSMLTELVAGENLTQKNPPDFGPGVR